MANLTQCNGNKSTPTRKPVEVNGLLAERLQSFLDLPLEQQVLVDAQRVIPTLEMHGLLDTLRRTGKFNDEPLYMGSVA